MHAPPAPRGARRAPICTTSARRRMSGITRSSERHSTSARSSCAARAWDQSSSFLDFYHLSHAPACSRSVQTRSSSGTRPHSAPHATGVLHASAAPSIGRRRRRRVRDHTGAVRRGAPYTRLAAHSAGALQPAFHGTHLNFNPNPFLATALDHVPGTARHAREPRDRRGARAARLEALVLGRAPVQALPQLVGSLPAVYACTSALPGGARPGLSVLGKLAMVTFCRARRPAVRPSVWS
jgi:hypothetical protein